MRVNVRVSVRIKKTTLTLETPINRAFQTKSEGVRAKMQKKTFFSILEVDE